MKKSFLITLFLTASLVYAQNQGQDKKGMGIDPKDLGVKFKALNNGKGFGGSGEGNRGNDKPVGNAGGERAGSDDGGSGDGGSSGDLSSSGGNRLIIKETGEPTPFRSTIIRGFPFIKLSDGKIAGVNINDGSISSALLSASGNGDQFYPTFPILPHFESEDCSGQMFSGYYYVNQDPNEAPSSSGQKLVSNVLKNPIDQNGGLLEASDFIQATRVGRSFIDYDYSLDPPELKCFVYINGFQANFVETMNLTPYTPSAEDATNLPMGELTIDF